MAKVATNQLRNVALIGHGSAGKSSVAESMLFAEGGANIGAIQIAGTTNTVQIPFFLAACDYTLIGEEIFAAGAYLSKEPNLVGTVVGQDWGRILSFCLMVIGCILANVAADQHKWLVNLLKKT